MSPQSSTYEMILASSSPYRKTLLERLGLPFRTESPEIDESARPGESARALVARLAREKARAISRLNPSAIVIGSDQVAVCGEDIVGKPGTFERAVEQLSSFSGREVVFHTAVALCRAETDHLFERTVDTVLRFRDLSQEEIRRYVWRENPLDCAGSFKSELGGISLFRAVESDDPTAIVGLPLIAVAEALRRAGFEVP
ncbi:MAG: septum formation protein Maf [Gammaproteobacteria bacterium]|nr:septum formation protein Maf [Gammaproteobacteria bacterium]